MITEHKNQKLKEDLIDLWIWKSSRVDSIKYFSITTKLSKLMYPFKYEPYARNMFSQYVEQAKTVYINNIATDMIVKCGLSLLWLCGKTLFFILSHFHIFFHC